MLLTSRSLAIVCLAVPFFNNLVSAGVVIDSGSCPGDTRLQNAVSVAIQMGATARDAMNAGTVRDAMNQRTKGAYARLFPNPEDNRAKVIDIFNKIASLQSASQEITIFCNENHVQTIDVGAGNVVIIDTKFTDASGQFLSRILNGPGPKDVITPGCENEGWWAWTTNGDKNSLNQAHVVLCSKAFNPGDEFDTRDPAVILQTGFTGDTHNQRQKNGFVLQQIRPLGRILFHEFIHCEAVGGASTDGVATIGDGGGYGYTTCTGTQGRANALVNADSYAELALALNLQLQNSNTFSWIVGRVLENGVLPGPKKPTNTKRYFRSMLDRAAAVRLWRESRRALRGRF